MRNFCLFYCHQPPIPWAAKGQPTCSTLLLTSQRYKTPVGKLCFHATETSKPEVKQGTAAVLRSLRLNSRLSTHPSHRLQSKAGATKVNCSRECKSLNMRQMKHEKRSSEPNNYSPLQENPLKKNKAIYNSAAEGGRDESRENNPPWKAILKFSE